MNNRERKQFIIDTLEKGSGDLSFLTYKGDSLLDGLKILAKYFPNQRLTEGGTTVVQKGNGDNPRFYSEVFSKSARELIEQNVSEEDILALGKLDWFYDDENDCLAKII